MKNHFLNWWPLYLLVGWIVLGLTAMAMFAQEANPARSYGAIDVIETTNFTGVTFAPVPCPHPECGDSHSVLATERYATVRDTWAEVVDAAGTPTGENRRLHSITNDWGSLTQEISHPSVYHMHTQPGYPVRPGTRWPGDLPPLPPWEAAKDVAWPKRSNASTLPSDTNLYGVLYNVTTPSMIAGSVLEKRSTDRSSGVRVWPGDAVERVTNQPAVETSSLKAPATFTTNSFSYSYLTFDGKVTTATNPNALKMVFHSRDGTTWKPAWTNTVDGSTLHRFRAVPATNAMPQARRFNP